MWQIARALTFSLSAVYGDITIRKFETNSSTFGDVSVCSVH